MLLFLPKIFVLPIICQFFLFVKCVKMSTLKLEQLLFNSGIASDKVHLKGKNKLIRGQEDV